MKDEIKRLNDLIAKSRHIVFFGGAGVSTESGIPDFRSVDGLYNQQYDYPPEIILSHTFWENEPSEFYRFYRNKMIYLDAKPNACHTKLAQMEQDKKLSAVITQNIDGLHQIAGSKKVYELHGSVHRNYCEKCRKFYTVNDVMNTKDIPYCECGGIIKPDVVLYEEPLPTQTMRDSINALYDADLLIIGGTSLGVYPAAGLIDYYKGKDIVLVNMSPTPQDGKASLILRDPIGEVFEQIEY